MVRRALQVLIAFLLAALVSAPATSWAGSRSHDGDDGDHGHHHGKRSNHVSKQDRLFARQAARSNLFEIKSSLLALQRSEDHDVRAFARLLIRDHSKQQVELAKIAEA